MSKSNKQKPIFPKNVKIGKRPPVFPEDLKPNHPPLYVNLSDSATNTLERIRAARGWNKKTAVESIIAFFDMHGDRFNFADK